MLALLLQENGTAANPSGYDLFQFFAAFVLILTIFAGAWLFTYWISKDE